MRSANFEEQRLRTLEMLYGHCGGRAGRKVVDVVDDGNEQFSDYVIESFWVVLPKKRPAAASACMAHSTLFSSQRYLPLNMCHTAGARRTKDTARS